MKTKYISVVIFLSMILAIGKGQVALAEENDDNYYHQLVLIDDIWTNMTDGEIDYSYTGMALNEYDWWYVKDGVLDLSYTGLALNDYGWWYIKNGKLDLSYTGLALNEYGWWYVKNGMLDLSYTGMALNEYGWWYVTNGMLDLSYTGLTLNEYGWWYMKSGVLDWSYNGLALNQYGWWRITNGAVDFNYTGITDSEYGWWYVTNGTIDYNYNGHIEDGLQAWDIVNGMAVSYVEQSFAANLPASNEYSQLVVVEAQGTNATVTMHENQNGVWTEILRTNGFVGSMGVGQASENTSVTPQGTFPLYFAFGINSNPGTSIPYLQVDDYDYWVDDTSSELYNQYVRTDTPYTEWSHAEHIIDYPSSYGYCLFIGYNQEGIQGAGSCFFLHCSNGRPTAGCVSVPEEDMIFILTHINDNCGIVIQ